MRRPGDPLLPPLTNYYVLQSQEPKHVIAGCKDCFCSQKLHDIVQMFFGLGGCLIAGLQTAGAVNVASSDGKCALSTHVFTIFGVTNLVLNVGVLARSLYQTCRVEVGSRRSCHMCQAAFSIALLASTIISFGIVAHCYPHS